MRIDEIAKLARQVVAESGSATTTVYLLRAGDQPRVRRVSRVGGDPIGIGEHNWPRLGSRPMDHLLTLDLQEMPALRTGPLGDARAISLFIGDRIVNEAFEPGTSETAVVVLSEADVGRGEMAPLRPAGAPPASVEITAVEVPSEIFADPPPEDEGDLTELWGKLFDTGAYAGGEPLWLQGPEHEGHFILQFDESFVEMNLGDAGVMYTFVDTAFWQCH